MALFRPTAPRGLSVAACCRRQPSSLRLLHIASPRAAQLPLRPTPAPPRLPAEEQRVFEKLQKASTGAFSTPRPVVVVNQPSSAARAQLVPQAGPSSKTLDDGATDGDAMTSETLSRIDARVSATGQGEELHPDIRRGAKPEFEGEVNPKTGEVGGPKNEPLRWGGGGDWSYNGRVTDF